MERRTYEAMRLGLTLLGVLEWPDLRRV